MDLRYIPVLVNDACGSGDQSAATRSLASLAAFGNFLQTDCKTMLPLLRRAAAPLEQG